MAVLTQPKNQTISQVSDLCRRLLAILREVDEVAAFVTANGFQTGGANVFVDADLAANAPWASAAQMQAALVNIQALSTAASVPIRNTFRVMEGGPNP